MQVINSDYYFPGRRTHMHGEAGSTHSHSHVVKVVIWERLQELRLFNRYEISQ
jgi:hypothetical protein